MSSRLDRVYPKVERADLNIVTYYGFIFRGRMADYLQMREIVGIPSEQSNDKDKDKRLLTLPSSKLLYQTQSNEYLTMQKKKYCPHCGGLLVGGICANKDCEACGKNVVKDLEQRFCPICGKQSNDEGVRE